MRPRHSRAPRGSAATLIDNAAHPWETSVIAGYSGTPLAKKLGIDEGSVLLLLHAPADLRLDLPPNVRVKRQARGRADVVVSFFTSARRLERRMDSLSAVVFPAGGLWVAWPKRSSGVPTDISDHTIREMSLARGLVDNKVCAINGTWSALRVVWRRENRMSGLRPLHPHTA